MEKKLTDILGSQYPIILGPMRFITLGKMAALVSEYGGFGQIAASAMTPERLRKEIREAKRLTRKPFGVNFPIYRPRTDELIEVAIEEGIKVITTSAGNPKKFIERIKRAGLKVLHKVATIDMAKKAEDVGVDAVIATGIEAGGHVGRDGATTFCLIPQLARALSIPVVAAGGGCNFALACDIRIASERARFGEVFVKRGVFPDWGGVYFLPRLVGYAKAAELFFSGEVIDATEALRIGMVNKVVPHEKLAEETRKFALNIANNAPLPIAFIKRGLQNFGRMDLVQALDFEKMAVDTCWNSRDRKEGFKSFLEKRPPHFIGC